MEAIGWRSRERGHERDGWKMLNGTGGMLR